MIRRILCTRGAAESTILVMEEDALLEGYGRFLESLALDIPPPAGANWHLRLVWMPSFRAERIHDIRSVNGAARVTLARCLRSACPGDAYYTAHTNRGVLESVPVETGTAQLSADDPVLALVGEGLPLRLTEPQRIGVDGETWS